uniref:Uncharacterized protein n=1 Tax=Panagrolaimus superbus TaxID=310955 RepID=A0A914YTD7_9BILA
MYSSSLLTVIIVSIFAGIIKAEEEWNGGRPPPFFPQGKERPIPRYAPTFSRYTPFLTEDTLPKPVYGRQQQQQHSSEIPPSIYKSQGRSIPRDISSSESTSEEREQPRYPPPFRNRQQPYYPEEFHGIPPRQSPPPRREYPEPFRGPRGEIEERRGEETSPPFLPPQYRGQRIPPPEYFSQRKEIDEHERPFFGPISTYSKPRQQQQPKSPESTVTSPPHKSSSSNYSAAPEHGSEVQLEKGKSRPDRLFAIKPPQFPSIPSPPPYPSPAPFTPPPTPRNVATFPEVTTRPSPSIYSPLQGPFPSETTRSANNNYSPTQEAPSVQQQPQQQQQQPGKPKPNVLPQSFRSFFPPGFGPFADGKIQRFQ